MKRLVGFTLFFSTAFFVVFVLNLYMYANVPEYHKAFEGAVSDDSDIPVVVVEKKDDGNKIMTVEEQKFSGNVITLKENEDVPLSASGSEADESKPLEKQIVEKKYYEDCGNGEGYWIITYSDGSTSVEQ